MNRRDPAVHFSFYGIGKDFIKIVNDFYRKIQKIRIFAIN